MRAFAFKQISEFKKEIDRPSCGSFVYGWHGLQKCVGLKLESFDFLEINNIHSQKIILKCVFK